MNDYKSMFEDEEPKARESVPQDVMPEAPRMWSLSPGGRFGRLNYINANVVLALILMAIMMLITSVVHYNYAFAFISVGLFVVYAAFAFRMIILRLHDLNLSGLWVIVYVVLYALSVGISFMNMYSYRYYNLGEVSILLSVIMFVLGLALLVVPGTKGQNKYGLQPARGSFAGLITIIVLIVISLASIFYILNNFRMGSMFWHGF